MWHLKPWNQWHNFILLDEQLPCMKLSQVRSRGRRTCMFLCLRWLIIWRVIGWCFVQFYAEFFWRIPFFFRFWPRLTLRFITWVSTKFWSRSISMCFSHVSLVSEFPVISGSLSQTTLEVWETCKNHAEMGLDRSVQWVAIVRMLKNCNFTFRIYWIL